MKTKSLIVALSIMASASIFTSCGGSKVADTKQVKSYVLMTSVSNDIINAYIEDYVQKLEAGKVKDVYVPDVKISYSMGNDMVDKNPWIEKTKIVLGYGFYDNWKNIHWMLSDEETESRYLESWTRNFNWNTSNIDILNKRIIKEYDHDALNELLTYRYAVEHHDDDSVVGLTVTHGFVKFIEKKVGKSVKIYDIYYSKDYSTKSVDAYYVIYTIDKDFYVLVRLAEEKKSSRFEIETLARGEQLIEIERTLNMYL